jgi:gamma-glutamyltranspeptidase/glutathione hydrolase
VLLNDEMDDFSAKPGVPNVYGLVGNEANAIAPGKRPLSSMSPTFIENERGVAIIGTPGGSRIISMVMLAALEYLQGGSAESMVERPRFHHQYLPDLIIREAAAFSEEEEAELQLMGHIFRPLDRRGTYGEQASRYGNMQVVVWDKKKKHVEAASDTRGIGAARVQ